MRTSHHVDPTPILVAAVQTVIVFRPTKVLLLTDVLRRHVSTSEVGRIR